MHFSVRMNATVNVIFNIEGIYVVKRVPDTDSGTMRTITTHGRSGVATRRTILASQKTAVLRRFGEFS